MHVQRCHQWPTARFLGRRRPAGATRTSWRAWQGKSGEDDTAAREEYATRRRSGPHRISKRRVFESAFWQASAKQNLQIRAHWLTYVREPLFRVSLSALYSRTIPFSPNIYPSVHWGRPTIGVLSMRSDLLLIASLLTVISSGASEARPSRHSTVAPECNVTMPCDFSGPVMRGGQAASYPQEQYGFGRRAISYRSRDAMAAVSGDEGQVVGGRPAGCPSAFCGCAASIHLFGHIVPELNLAANWLRFPRTSPAPGMVAARRGHVFVLEQHVEGDVWMAYDGNSGGRATRIHARSLRGYTVVNPRAA